MDSAGVEGALARAQARRERLIDASRLAHEAALEVARRLESDQPVDASADVVGTQRLEAKRWHRFADDALELVHRWATGQAAVRDQVVFLTRPEAQVLEFLPTAMSFEEIGRRIGAPASAVRAHAIALYRVLGVVTRGEAVTRSVELGLLDRATPCDA